MNGKGDKRRPSSVSKDQFDENWDKIFGANHDNFDLSKVDMTQACDFGAPTRDGSHLIDGSNPPTDLWAFPPKKGKPLREVAYDGMWKHSCTVEMAIVWIGKDETCSYCGAWEEDGDDLPISLKD